VFRLSAALAAAYAALAVLVATGVMNGLDQWSVDHLMPGLGDASVTPTKTEAVVPLLHSGWGGPLDVAANIVTLPGQAIIGSALAAACLLVLARRGRTHAALAWLVAWIAANAVEVLCKSVLSRPLLHHDGAPLWAFQSSWPSGHTLRSVLLAATVAAVWPRASRWVAAWAAASLVLLEIDGFHVPTDIAGGLLLALLAAGLARREAAYERHERR
jgi:membrane-associated phospholipid phosphatase